MSQIETRELERRRELAETYGVELSDVPTTEDNLNDFLKDYVSPELIALSGRLNN
jgi:hypothetical protein